ncbi:hypothetical protein [Frankia sp. AvcI1]|uniref:hypothetical protein n=1 Tax=Frankia sp. AvcI1 TaxID=573496 RepID=UPI002118ACB1|nr:hypothetical protein [Frankia sp. AvcI1]
MPGAAWCGLLRTANEQAVALGRYPDAQTAQEKARVIAQQQAGRLVAALPRFTVLQADAQLTSPHRLGDQPPLPARLPPALQDSQAKLAAVVIGAGGQPLAVTGFAGPEALAQWTAGTLRSRGGRLLGSAPIYKEYDGTQAMRQAFWAEVDRRLSAWALLVNTQDDLLIDSGAAAALTGLSAKTIRENAGSPRSKLPPARSRTGRTPLWSALEILIYAERAGAARDRMLPAEQPPAMAQLSKIGIKGIGGGGDQRYVSAAEFAQRLTADPEDFQVALTAARNGWTRRPGSLVVPPADLHLGRTPLWTQATVDAAVEAWLGRA